MIQPLSDPQLVSSTIVPGRYRRAAGTSTSAGPKRKPPASRSRIAANTLGASNRGRHNHSTFPLGATSAVTSQSDRKAYSSIGGYGERLTLRPLNAATIGVSSHQIHHRTRVPRRRYQTWRLRG